MPMHISFVSLFIRVIFLLFLTLNASSAVSEQLRESPDKAVLDNGAVVLSKYLPGSPIVNIQIRVLSGLSNEGEYAGTGISHFLEHILYKGTGAMDSRQIRKAIKLMGGVSNASTGLDSAEYHITVMNKDFEKAFDLLADIVMEPVFTPEDFDQEKSVILKELRYRNDDPVSSRLKKLFSVAYSDNVYALPIIGDEDRFKALTPEDLRRYHAEVYTPDRVVVGVTGGVDLGRALKAVEEKFSKYKSVSDWDPVVSLEPRQARQKVLVAEEEVALGYLAMGFHSTSIYSPEVYAGDVLSIILGEGKSSRLYRKLVKEKKLLYSVAGFNYTPRYPGLFIVTGIASPEDLQGAVDEIFSEIARIKREGVDPDELEKAKNLVVSDFLHSHEKVSSLNSMYTISEQLLQDPGFLRTYTEKVNDVTEDDIVAFCEKYLTKNNSTVIELVPDGFPVEELPFHTKEGAGVSDTSVKDDLFETTAGRNLEAGQNRGVIPLQIDTRSGEQPRELFQQLPNGLKVIIKEKGVIPIASATLAVPGGLRSESASNNGISHLTTALMLKGTKDRKEVDIIPEIENRGGAITSFSGMNTMGINLDVLSRDIDIALEILSDAAQNSVFPEDEILSEKTRVIAAIEEEDKSIFDVGIRNLRRILYGDHPYALRIIGEVLSIHNLSRPQIAEFYEKRFAPEGAVLTIVGGIDAVDVLESVRDHFSSWKGTISPIESVKVKQIRRTEESKTQMRKEQALVLYGFYGADINSPQKYPLSVISSILSGTDGMLFDLLREEQGLTYASGAISSPEVDTGYFMIYAATIAEAITHVKTGIEDSVTRIQNGDFSPEDLLASKNRLITQQASSLESNLSLSLIMAIDEIVGSGFSDHKLYSENVSRVSAEDISKTAKNALNLENCGIEIIRPAQRQ